MKNYRNIVAAALVLMMGLSVYSLVNGNVEKIQKIDELQRQATDFTEKGLLDRAAAKYGEIIALDNRIEYYIAISDLFTGEDYKDARIKACEKTMLQFPDDPRAYVQVLNAYVDNNKLNKAYEVLDNFDGRRLQSSEVEAIRNDIKYRYYTESLGADDTRNPSGNYAAVCLDEKWGFVTMQGANIVRTLYTQVGDFANGVAPVKATDGQWYQVDTKGVLVQNISSFFEQAVENVGIFNDGLMPIAVGGKYSYYDEMFHKQGEDYDFCGGFNQGIAAVRKGDVWALIAPDGHVIQDGFQEIVMDDRNLCCIQERIAVKKDGKYFLVDRNGKQIGTQTFDGIKSVSNGPLVAVKSENKWGYIDLKGDLAIEPSYEDAMSFSNGLAAVCVNGLWGYIDPENKLVIPAEFDACSNISSAATAFVKNRKSWKLLKLYSNNY